MRPILFAVSLSVTSGFAVAQEPFRASQFRASQWLPSNYRNVISVDLVALRDSGVWDEMVTGLLKVAFEKAEEQVGFKLDALDRLTMVPVRVVDEDGHHITHRLTLWEGNAPLATPAVMIGYEDETIGAFDVKRRRWGDEVFVQPRPEIRLEGSRALLQGPLAGIPSNGLPCADLMSLLSGKEQALLQIVAEINDDRARRDVIPTLFDDVEWSAGDEPSFLSMRLFATGEEDDPNLEFEAVFRHAKAGAGLTTTQQAIDAFLGGIRQDPRFRLLVPLFAKMECRRDGTDLRYRIDLGRSRVASGTLSMLALPLVALSSDVAAIEQVEVIEVEAEAPRPKPVEKKKDPKKHP